MLIKNYRFLLCLTGTVLLTMGVIFSPRYISRSLDMNSMNQIITSERENFSFLEQSSNGIFDAVHAFRYLQQDGKNPVLLTSIEEPVQINDDLIQEIYLQAMKAYEFNMLPWMEPMFSESIMDSNYKIAESRTADLSVRTDWSNHVKSAQYYSLTYESAENPEKKELLNFWYVCFSDEQRFDYSFIVNAVNYQIYYAEIHNASTQVMAEEAENLDFYVGDDYYEILSVFGTEFAKGCARYYEAFEYDVVNQKDLYQKMNIAILYFENRTPLYITRSAVNEENPKMYDGICVGFQDLIQWVQRLPDT